MRRLGASVRLRRIVRTCRCLITPVAHMATAVSPPQAPIHYTATFATIDATLKQALDSNSEVILYAFVRDGPLSVFRGMFMQSGTPARTSPGARTVS